MKCRQYKGITDSKCVLKLQFFVFYVILKLAMKMNVEVNGI